jgi:hypothetical protein
LRQNKEGLTRLPWFLISTFKLRVLPKQATNGGRPTAA